MKTGIDDFFVVRGNGAKARKEFLKLARRPLFIPDGFSAAELQRMKFAATKFAADGLLPLGLTVFSGPPKAGKSWLVLDLLYSIARGEKALGSSQTRQGQVAYLALEDSAKRLQKRLHDIEAARRAAGLPVDASGMHFFDQWPNDPDTAVLALQRLLEQRREISVVAVDTLAKLRSAPKSNGHLYFEDYAAMAALKRIADARGVALLVVTHERKGDDDDPFKTISGSTGITGAADSILVLKRKRNAEDATLVIGGRDVVGQELALGWKFPRWTVLGDAQLHRLSKERRDVLQTLEAHPNGLTPMELKGLLGTTSTRQAMQSLVLKLVAEGLVIGRDRGRYVLARSLKKGEENE